MYNEVVDYILKSNYIFTSVEEKPFQGYVAVKRNKIFKVGRGECSCIPSDESQIIDLGDQLITPGFIDVHTFFTGYAIFYIGVDMSNAQSQEDFMMILKGYVSQKEKHKSIFGHGWNPKAFLVDGLEEKLTEYYPEQPVVIFSANRGSCVMNQKARVMYKFTPETCYPEAYYRIMREYLNDRAFIEPQFKKYMDLMNSRGVTTVKEMGFDTFYGFDDFLKEKEEKDELTLRTFFMSQPVGEGINVEHGKKMREKFQNDFIRFSGYNRMTDGTVASGRGDLLEPYEGTDRHCLMDIDYAMIEKEVKLADENGFRYSLHAQGDGAVHKVTEIFNKCQKENGKLVNRHAITDMEFSNPEDLKRMGEIGVIGEIYFQIMSLDPAEEVKKSIEKTIGIERGKYFWNRRGMLDSGMILSGATDLPLMITDIPEAIYHGCGGYFPEGTEQYNTQNTITISEMLKAWTIGGAFNLSMEDKLGTLEEGKYADITVLNRNIFDMPMEEMRNVKVSMTMVNGKIVYRDK